MKNLRFESIELVSHVEKKAAKFQFDPNCNLILGDNGTGKSSLLKSLYWTMGAEPAVLHEEWLAAAVTGSLKISVDKSDYYTVYRKGGTVKVFDVHDKCLISTQHFTKELGPFFAKMFEIALKLKDRKGQSVTPPPAYLFVPFYVDQDGGWTGPWRSFAKLEQFVEWKNDAVQFHTGQRKNEYYSLATNLEFHKSQVDMLLKEQSALRLAFNRLDNKTRKLPLAFDRDAYKRAVRALLGDLNRYQKDKETQLGKLNEVTNRKILLAQQLRIAQNAFEEVSRDAIFVEGIDADEILCPTCGTTHSNSLQNKFALVETLEDYRDFILTSQADLEKLEAEEEAATKLLEDTTSTIKKLEQSITEKSGTIKVADVIESEGNKRARSILKEQLDYYVQQISKLDGEIASEKRAIAKLTDKKRAEIIIQDFNESYSKYLDELAVTGVHKSDGKKIPMTVSDTGSELPRAVLAYNFAVLSALHKHSSSGDFPIVVDSPLQQDQDPTNTIKILKFLSDHVSDERQMFIGSVRDHGVAFDGKVFTLSQKKSLLRADLYESVAANVARFSMQTAD